MSSNVVALIKVETQKNLINLAKKSGLSTDAFLNVLLNDEIERQRLMAISAELAEEDHLQTIPSIKIVEICNQYLSKLDSESESHAIKRAIEHIFNDLLKKNLLSVNSREDQIMESKRLKTSRIAYYWYAGTLSKRIAMWFGALDVYLYHDLLYPMSELIFVGMPANVEVCHQIFSYLYNIFKKATAAYKKDAGKWGTKAEMEKEAHRYMYDFVNKLDSTNALIENDNYNKHLYDYADNNFKWAMRD